MLAYTVEKQNKTLTLTCSDGRKLVTDKWSEVADFLLMPTDMAVVWHVDIFVDDITSTMPMDLRNKVLKGGRVYTTDSRKLFYAPGRMFGINQVNFYSLERYAEDRIDDVLALADLGNKVLKAYEQIGLKVETLSSPVAVYLPILERLDFPRAYDLPESAFNLLQKCSEKAWVEWRELFRVGHWQADEVMDFDVQAAYPSLIANLPDIRGAKFFESDEMLDDADYSWGELEGVLKITSDVTPFGFVGTKEEQITTEHLWLINKYELGTFQMKHGRFFKLPQYYKLPFKKTMQELYKARQNENPIVRKIAKAIAVGIGGKFSQRYEDGRLGEFYNSIYSRIITSRCSIKVADFIHRYGLASSIISILVDGFLAESNNLNINVGNNGMGSWRINPSSPFLVASLLYQWGADRHPNGKKYIEMMEMIKNKPNSPVYAGVDLNLIEHVRNFPQLPRTGGELLSKHYTSTPIKV